MSRTWLCSVVLFSWLFVLSDGLVRMPFRTIWSRRGALKPGAVFASVESTDQGVHMDSHSKHESAFVYDPKKIRNFCIIAHIDHGKSTLADRLLEQTGTVESRNMQNQLLDNLDIERERGITIKLQAARMNYRARDGQQYLLNLIDTPGHVDFGYEVSRSLAACEGALLVVDATQGVQAQTLANAFQAVEHDLQLLPVINKVDLPSADVARTIQEIESTIGLDCSNALCVSAKTGQGVNELLEQIVHSLPPPRSLVTPQSQKENCEHAKAEDVPLRALIFDSHYDAYRGVVVVFRVVQGTLRAGDKIKLLHSQQEFDVLELGILLADKRQQVSQLRAGEVGFLSAHIKDIEHARVGDTIALASDLCANAETALPGYAPAKQMVYAGLYPSEAKDYEALRDSLGKLRLNDASFTFTPETSSAMGFGFRCGFLGLLHMDIVQERLEREYDVDLIVTAPSVVYEVLLSSGPSREGSQDKSAVVDSAEDLDGTLLYIDTPSKLPDPQSIKEVREPFVRLEMIAPADCTGALMELATQRRGIFSEMKYITPERTTIVYEMPLAEVITDFFDQLKSKTKGYASMSFTDIGYRAQDLVKLDIRINGEDAPPLSSIVHRSKSHEIGKAICNKLKDLIPRQQFKVPIQACIGSKPIASAHISAVMKDVLAKCYGGDITRKKKLLQKQARGKKRMKLLGKVSVPQEAFLSIIRVNSDEGSDN